MMWIFFPAIAFIRHSLDEGGSQGGVNIWPAFALGRDGKLGAKLRKVVEEWISALIL